MIKKSKGGKAKRNSWLKLFSSQEKQGTSVQNTQEDRLAAQTVSESTNRNKISMAAILLGLCLVYVGSSLKELSQTIIVNIGSNLITTGFFSLLILDRISSGREREDRRNLNAALARNQQKIEVIFVEKESKKSHFLPLEMIREEFSRAEVLARIGMLPKIKKGDRFSIEYTGEQEFLRGINAVLAYETTKLVIECAKEELEQFTMFAPTKLDNIVDTTSQKKIRIFLVEKESNNRFELPLEMLRKDFNRGEVLARIGMLPTAKEGVRFSIEYTGEQEFLCKINDISINDGCKDLEIECTKEEIEQFKIFAPIKLDE